MMLLDEAKVRLLARLRQQGWDVGERVNVVSARDLSPTEAIGKPDRDDYPLLTGKEVMMEARIRDSAGQAFTDQAGKFDGTLADVMALPLNTNYRRAVFVATLNAVLRNLGEAEATVHCKDKEPALCARQLPAYLRET